MKYFIASDIHGSAYYCEKMLEAYKREKADRLILLGDILYHGPRNDLPRDYAPKRVIEMLNAYKNDILCVRGKCDTDVDQMVLEFPILADYALLSMDGLSVIATHGHKYNKETPPAMRKNEILLHGHTHVLKCEEFGDNNWYLNPGSVALPKENLPRTYMVYENRSFKIKDFMGEIIIEKQF